MISDDIDRHRTDNPIQNIKNFLKLFMIAQEETDSKCVSDPYAQTCFGKTVTEEVNYGSPIQTHQDGPLILHSASIKPFMLD